jgi:DNA-binding transcriptional LysR family regulator
LLKLAKSRKQRAGFISHSRQLPATSAGWKPAWKQHCFIRSANGASLTERGAHLRERVQDVFAELEQILRELDGTREVNGTLTLAASTTVARYFVPRIFIRFHHYHPAAALHLIVGNTEEVLDHLRHQRVGLGLVEGHQRSPGVRLEQFMPDEIVPVCAPRIPDPKQRRAIEGLKSVRDLESLPLIWRESGSGTRAVVESVLKDSGVNPRKLDQRFELGSTEVIKSLVIAGLGVGFFSCWEIQQEIAMGLVRQISIPGLRIQRMFSWALPSGELGGLPGEFYQFANSIRSELSAVSKRLPENRNGNPGKRWQLSSSDQGSFAEKNPFFNHCVIAAQPEAQQKDRGRP